MSALVLHEYRASGNCYKIRLTAAHLGIELERREYDIAKGETRTPEFLKSINANGRIPVLQDGDRFLAESNAICFYLADGSALIPAGRFERADMLHWLFWEQYNHEPNIATLRFWLRFVGLDALTAAQRMQLTGKREAGRAALDLMDRHLDRREWLAGTRLSIADIALYAYTHVAGDAGFDLAAFPAINRWMKGIVALPGHVTMTEQAMAFAG